MSRSTKQSFLFGSFILVMSTVLVKIIGAIYKLPLTNYILGEMGMGYFTFAYNMYLPIYVLATAGLPVAVSRMVAQNVALKSYKNVRKILKISTSVFIVTGTIGLLIMFFGAGFYTRVNYPNSFLCVMVMSPTILFACLQSAQRGYYEGLRNMYPTAISSVEEASSKMVIGFAASYGMMKYLENQYLNTGAVFGKPVASLEEAHMAGLPYVAAAAIAGVTIGAVLSMLYLYFRHKIKGDGISQLDLQRSPAADDTKKLIRSLVRIGIPVCIGALVMNLSTMIDTFSIKSRLDYVMQVDPQTVINMYGANLTELTNVKDIPGFLWGCYSGIAITMFNFIPMITTNFGISALPLVTTSWAVKDGKGTKKGVETVLRVVSLVAMPAGLGYFAMSKPILTLLYSHRLNGVAIASPLLAVMGIAVIFVSMSTPINSMLQAVGRADLPVKIMLVGAVIKLATNYALVGMPSVNIMGAPYGTVLCYAVIVGLSLFYLRKITGVSINLYRTFVKPAIAGGMCAAAAYGVNGLLARLTSAGIAVVVSLTVAVFVYLLAIILLKVIEKDDILAFPKGEKIAKALEKYKIIS